MAKKLTDREIVARLSERFGVEVEPFEAKYDEEGRVFELDLTLLRLTELPPEIGQLTKLEKLNLTDNQLTSLPPEIGRLTYLQTLDLSGNLLTVLPQLANLKSLSLGGNQLTILPPEIGRLTRLRSLYLNNNQLTSLPPEIGRLTHLQNLLLNDNQLTSLPPEIGRLTSLWSLYLNNNQLTSLPPEIGCLTSLRSLYLTNNQLIRLPAELGRLLHLLRLLLNTNQLTHLPAELGQLHNLDSIDLSTNRLRQLPTEFGLLTQLGYLPRQLSLFDSLESQPLNVDNNPNLLSPPPEIVARGTQEILAFLRELHESGTIRYEAKLLVVGEGGTGKSSLLRALRGEDFDPELDTTHGIEVGKYPLSNPEPEQPELTLNTWDFGGQHIYHATHQFFLTQRSLYVVVWNARLGPDQGRLNYWLDTIKALAPDAPVLLVATHTDERSADLNYPLYTEAYPQLVGNLNVSNKTGRGIAELRDALAQHAAALPLMGQPWPQKWIDVEQALLARTDHHINLDTYTAVCTECGVDEEIARGTLGTYLHDLGKILYFRDDNVLCNLIVLKPNWVTKAISRVLTDEQVIAAKGILRHADLPRIWATDDDGRRYDPRLYPVFLRLMERFDLSYQLAEPGEQATASLVPQLLPHQPPADLPPWPETPPAGQAQVEMIYRLDFVPAGIMSWFIVRTHRYSRDLHWREGVMLEYEGHQARAELNPMLRELRLIVQGPLPQNFFTILKNTIDLILARFEGLRITRDVPCICHRQRGASERCPRFYRYEDLARRMEAGRTEVECPDSFELVSVPTMLYGIHVSTNQQVMRDIARGQEQIRARMIDPEKFDLLLAKTDQQSGQIDLLLAKTDQQSELMGRYFTRQWNYEMKSLEAECPNTFFLMPGSRHKFNPRNWVSQEYQLYLVCQHPAGPHSVGEGYSVRQSAEWWATLGPWLNQLIQFFEFAVPMGSHLNVNMQLTNSDKIQSSIELMEAITKSLPDLSAQDPIKGTHVQPHLAADRQVAGPALRVLHSFLKEADPTQHWSDLHKIVTPDGNILWLCAEHRLPYEIQPLVLDLPPEA